MAGERAPVILVVDDDESARRLVRMGLELEGAAVVEADTLARARNYLNRRMRGVVLDRELPDGDGLELLADIGATCPDVPVVVNSTLDDRREPTWVVKVDKGDLPEIVRGLDLAGTVERGDEELAVIDLVRNEAEAVVGEWRELCRWDPLLPPDSDPPVPRLVVDAIIEALQRPQPIGWGPDPALASVTELFASSAGAVDVAIGQLICLREAFRRHLAGHVPPAEQDEARARVDMLIDRAIWTTSRVAAARLQRQSLLDPLTGVGNRRSFDEQLDAELNRSYRYGRPLTVVIAGFAPPGGVDLDEATEAQVRRLAGVFATNLRAQDGVHRIETTTFALLLPETPAVVTPAVVDRLRAAGAASLGVAFGSASFPDDAEDVVGLLHTADMRRAVDC